MDADKLDRLAGRQYGLASLRQLRKIATDWEIDWWIRAGRLIPFRRGVFRTPGAPLSWEQVVLADTLAAGDDSCASHRTAARLHRLRGFYEQPDVIDITVKAPREIKIEGVRAHSTQFLEPWMVGRVGPIPVTSIARTIIDLSWVLDRWELARVVDDALRRGILHLESLRRCYEAIPPKGRRRARAVRWILEARPPGYTPGDSNSELRVIGWLHDAGFTTLRLGVRAEVAGKKYRLDIADPDAKVDLEFDDWFTHGTKTAHDSDRERDLELELDGWLVRRVTSKITRDRLIAVVRDAYERAIRTTTRPDTHLSGLLDRGGGDGAT